MNFPLTRPPSRITAPEKKLTRGTRSAKERSGAGGSQPPSAQEIPDGPFPRPGYVLRQAGPAMTLGPKATRDIDPGFTVPNAEDQAAMDAARRELDSQMDSRKRTGAVDRTDYIDRRLSGAAWRLRGDETGGWRATSGPMRGMTEGDTMARLNDEYDSSMSGGYAGRGLSGMGGGGRRGISTFQGVDGYDRTSRTASSRQTFNPPVGGVYDQALKTMGEKGSLPGQTPVAPPKAVPVGGNIREGAAALSGDAMERPSRMSPGQTITLPDGTKKNLGTTQSPAVPAAPAFKPKTQYFGEPGSSTISKPAAPNTADEFTTSPAGKRRRNPTFGMTAQQAGEFATATARLGEEKKAAQARVDAASAAPPRINNADSYASSLGIRLPKDRMKRAAFAGI